VNALSNHRPIRLVLCLLFLIFLSAIVPRMATAAPSAEYTYKNNLQSGETIHLSPPAQQRPGTHQVLIYDSYTGGNYAFSPDSPRSHIGSALTLAQPATAYRISRAVVYMVSFNTATHQGLSVNLKFWDLFKADRSQVFRGGPMLDRSYYYHAPFQTEANKVYEMIVDFSGRYDGNIALPAFANAGITVNFDSASGGAGLTPLITYGTALPVIGGVPELAPPYGFYRNVDGQTDFNFKPEHRRTLPGINQPTLLALKLYAWANDATPTPAPATVDTIGVYKDGMFYLRDTNTAGVADVTKAFGGAPSDIPFVFSTAPSEPNRVGVYRSSTAQFLVSINNTAYIVVLGNPGDRPLTGRWNIYSEGDSIGVFRPNNRIVYLASRYYYDSVATADYFAIFGNPGDQAVAGDWDGNGYDSIGVYRPAAGQWYLTNNSYPDGVTQAEISTAWSIGNFPPLAGDWNGDGRDTLGYQNTANGVFVLHSTITSSGADTVFPFGPTGGIPIAGRWTPRTAPSPLSGVLQGSGSFSNDNTFIDENGD
jgi:hypothetical protein